MIGSSSDLNLLLLVANDWLGNLANKLTCANPNIPPMIFGMNTNLSLINKPNAAHNVEHIKLAKHSKNDKDSVLRVFITFF